MLFGLIKTRKDARHEEERGRKTAEIESVSRDIRALAEEISVRLSAPMNCPASGKRCPFSGPPPAYGPVEPTQ